MYYLYERIANKGKKSGITKKRYCCHGLVYPAFGFRSPLVTWAQLQKVRRVRKKRMAKARGRKTM
jgi:hypothetical protein